MNIINEYNLLCEHIPFHIPTRVRNIIHKEFKNHKMPILLLNPNNDIKPIKKRYEEFSNLNLNSSFKDYNSNSSEKSESSPIFKMKNSKIKRLAQTPIKTFKLSKQNDDNKLGISPLYERSNNEGEKNLYIDCDKPIHNNSSKPIISPRTNDEMLYINNNSEHKYIYENTKFKEECIA